LVARILRFAQESPRRAALVWALFLFALTSWPSPPEVPIVSTTPNFDKLIHFTLYAVQAFLIYRAVRWPGKAGTSLARVLAVVGLMAVWAIADETHQFWIPGRSMEGGDVAADVVGATAGALAASITSGRPRRASPDKPQKLATEAV
jgi:VanZ family protein